MPVQYVLVDVLIVASTAERYFRYCLSAAHPSRYNLQPDVRESLYSYCRQWNSAIGPHRRFLGGNQPNLADLVSSMLTCS